VLPLCNGINELALFSRALCLCRSSEDATKSSTSPTSTDQIPGFVDGNPKTKRKEMRDSVSLGFFFCVCFLRAYVFLSEYFNFIL
jgi:hypothetical protein